ncbi:MAG: flavin reductase family protein [Microbacterium sp.]
MFYEPDARDRALLPHDPFKAIIAPRPIGWISTLDAEGTPNLAPYSFFNAVADRPPIIMFSSAGMKDSASHALARREFVWNLATWDLREAMNLSSAELDRGASEFAFAGLEQAASRLVAPPRVAASPVALECVVTQSLELTDAAGKATDRHLVFGQVVGVHIDERFILADGRVDTAGMRPIARSGSLAEYSVVDEVFHLARPRSGSSGPGASPTA